eukprot:CAMPEP_0201866388 /NCGR_PEP_ID=MMETSP0902-20130614/1004_1 /ASSEMBLY_ACC=CAM_ASM_000551 /TAXON_ID=420261 /ORGANISM="Thalassiosira antarctica, Strain CCMP982" /LENGTH=45 /DNA_ID= /DNA_START= /DNA_END= /DNA_ORIENTATION=
MDIHAVTPSNPKFDTISQSVLKKATSPAIYNFCVTHHDLEPNIRE